MSHAANTRSTSSARLEAGRGRRVLRIAREVSATLASDFFHTLVKHLAGALEADCAYIGELTGPFDRRIRPLAVYRNAGPSDPFDLDLDGTAAGQVMADGFFACGKEVRQLFPLDEFLGELQAQAFAGTLLSDAGGRPLGLVALIFSRQQDDLPLVKSVLETFRARAAAELERKRADDHLRESEERYRAFVSVNPDAMWRVEFDQPIPVLLPEDEQIERIYAHGYVAECNEAMDRLAGGRTAEQLIGARFGDLAPRTDARVVEELRSAIRSGFRSMTVATSPVDESGRRLYRLRSQLGIVENGQLQRIWITTRDITELRRAELSLEASERRFREVLDNIQMPALMLERDATITFSNDCLLRLAHWSREELLGRNWLEEIVPPDEGGIWRDALFSARHFEGTILPREAAPCLIAWSTTVLRNQEGQEIGLAALGVDITSQRKLEAALRLAEKLESIGRLAGGIAHDFNNLLTVVRGHADQLLLRKKRSDPDYFALAAIQEAAGKCAELTQQLLTIGGRTAFHPKKIKIDKVIAAEETIVRSLIGGTIELLIRLESGRSVYADPVQLQRLLANLVTNARDAMPGGGLLIIETTNIRILEGSTDYPETIKPGDYVQVAVIDTGIGLSEESKAHLFEPFFTTKDPGKGTGLGLSTVHGIVSQSHGHIVVHSNEGAGTTFEVLFPAVEA